MKSYETTRTAPHKEETVRVSFSEQEWTDRLCERDCDDPVLFRLETESKFPTRTEFTTGYYCDRDLPWEMFEGDKAADEFFAAAFGIVAEGFNQETDRENPEDGMSCYSCGEPVSFEDLVLCDDCDAALQERMTNA